jgi:hypothetical protein
MPESKSKFLIPVVGSVAIVAGGIAAYLYLKTGPGGNISGALASAKIVPDEALMATYISTDPKVWAKFEEFGTPEARSLVAEGLKEFNKEALENDNLSYERDIKPWIGGVMVAILPPTPAKSVQNSSQADTASESAVLMIVGIKDKVNALNFANKLRTDKTFQSREIEYKGEKIIESSGDANPTYSVVLNDYVAFSPNKKAVEQAIDTYKGEPSFATKEGASNLFTKGVNVENTLAQIYMPDYGNTVQQLIAASPQAAQLPPQSIAQLKQVKSFVAGVGIDNAGVRMRAVANLDPELVKFQYQHTNAQVVSQLPSDTIALISGQGISTWWSGFVEQSKEVPEFNQALLLLREQLKTIDLDLDKDIFGWMNGEFGLAVIPSNEGLLGQVGFGGALVFHTNDRKTAQATLTKLDNLVKAQQINVATRNISGKDVTEWQIPLQGSLLAHGWLNQDTLFVALGGPIAETLVAQQGRSLKNSDNFKAITDSLQKPNGGYFYLDMDNTVPLLNRLAQAQSQPIPPEASAIMSSIRGLGMTASSPDKSTTQVELLLALKPKTEKN